MQFTLFSKIFACFRESFGDEMVGIEEGKKENRSDNRYMFTIREFLDVSTPHSSSLF